MLLWHMDQQISIGFPCLANWNVTLPICWITPMLLVCPVLLLGNQRSQRPACPRLLGNQRLGAPTKQFPTWSFLVLRAATSAGGLLGNQRFPCRQLTLGLLGNQRPTPLLV